MKKKCVCTLLILLVLIALSSCSSQKGHMRKHRSKKCNCPTWSVNEKESNSMAKSLSLN
ncbi:MAG: hypothetical protein IJ748_02200 [Bacteroidales bacterium]|nr:hypothetical protein [Bacteroidales bacterium]